MCKANLASNATLNLINKIKPLDWNSIEKLYQALVKSTVLYASPVWSLRYLDRIEKLQTQFFKKTLGLFQGTPNYAIRVETNKYPIAVAVFQLLLDWVEKILSMPDYRYPRICFLKLKDLSKNTKNNVNDKYNWFIQIKKKFFEPIKEADSWINISLDMVKEHKYRYIELF